MNDQKIKRRNNKLKENSLIDHNFLRQEKISNKLKSKLLCLKLVLYAHSSDQEFTNKIFNYYNYNDYNNHNNYYNHNNIYLESTPKLEVQNLGIMVIMQKKIKEIILVRKDGFVLNKVNGKIFYAASSSLETLSAIQNMKMNQLPKDCKNRLVMQLMLDKV